MGDRANILVVDEVKDGAVTGGIYLYTHWSGSEWPEMLRTALKQAEPRWGDDSYCTRILVSSLFSDIHDSETGGGISTHRTWGDGYPVLIVDQINQKVHTATEREETEVANWDEGLTFAEYVAQSSAVWTED